MTVEKKRITSLTKGFTPVVANIDQNDLVPLDLSLEADDLKAFDISSSSDFENYIEDYLRRNQSKAAYGGYNEKRGIYRRSNHFNSENVSNERNIHLGIDIWCPAYTDIIAPLDGIIHSFKDNQNYGDYGPTIILKHTFEDFSFFSLYGHLSRESLATLEVNKKISKGQVFAQLGEPEVNGDYAPHLHFQLILDLEGNLGDYPGVTDEEHLDFYLKNCPDPNLILKLNPV